jgi:hypothetical protein
VIERQDTLPAVVPVGRFLIQTQHLIVALSHVAVYPTSCMLELQLSGQAGGPGPEMFSVDAFNRLAFAVRFGEEILAVLDDWRHLARNRGPLQLSNSSYEGGQSAGRADCKMSLWLHPLPPPQPGTLTIIAPDLGPQLMPCPLDGHAIVAAAAQAQPYWQV